MTTVITAIVFTTLGIAIGYRGTRGLVAHEELGSTRRKLPKFRKERRSHTIRSLVLAGVTLIIIVGLAQGAHH